MAQLTPREAHAFAGSAVHYAAANISGFLEWVRGGEPLLADITEIELMTILAETHDVIAPDCDVPIV